MTMKAVEQTRQRHAKKAAAVEATMVKRAEKEKQQAAKRIDCECCGLSQIINHPRGKPCSHLHCDRGECKKWKSMPAVKRALIVASQLAEGQQVRGVEGSGGEQQLEGGEVQQEGQEGQEEGGLEEGQEEGGLEEEQEEGGLEEEEEAEAESEAGAEAEAQRLAAVDAVLAAANSTSVEEVGAAFSALDAFATGEQIQRTGRKRKPTMQMQQLAEEAAERLARKKQVAASKGKVAK